MWQVYSRKVRKQVDEYQNNIKGGNNHYTNCIFKLKLIDRIVYPLKHVSYIRSVYICCHKAN